jgi:hypothetical protein
MDIEWVRDRLTDFAGKLAQYDAGVQYGDHKLWPEVCRAERTIRKIFTELDPRLAEEFDLGSEIGELQASTLVQQALGILDDRDEWATRLKADAPTLPADEFHPWVWEAAQTFWASEHCREAVRAAANAINAHTQTKINRKDIYNDDLMNQAFTSTPKAGEAYLRLPGDPTKDQTLKSRNNALRPFAQGCIAGIRNPADHELECLAALSILARWIDECEVRRD